MSADLHDSGKPVEIVTRPLQAPFTPCMPQNRAGFKCWEGAAGQKGGRITPPPYAQCQNIARLVYYARLAGWVKCRRTLLLNLSMRYELPRLISCAHVHRAIRRVVCRAIEIRSRTETRKPKRGGLKRLNIALPNPGALQHGAHFRP
jgi:hypothetical protein